MPADIELGVTFDTDQAVKDLENDLDDVKVEPKVSTERDEGSGGAAASGIDTGRAVQQDGGAEGIGAEAGLLGAEAGTDVATGSGKGGALGSIAGGVGKGVALLGAIAGFLALLEPVQKAIGFIARQFELLVVPFVAALRPLLEILQQAVVRVLQFFRNPGALLEGIKNALAPFANTIINGLNNIPGVDIDRVQTEDTQGGFRQTGQSQRQELKEDVAEGVFGAGGNAAGAVPVIAEKLTNSLISDDAFVEKLSNKLSSGKAGNVLE